MTSRDSILSDGYAAAAAELEKFVWAGAPAESGMPAGRRGAVAAALARRTVGAGVRAIEYSGMGSGYGAEARRDVAERVVLCATTGLSPEALSEALDTLSENKIHLDGKFATRMLTVIASMAVDRPGHDETEIQACAALLAERTPADRKTCSEAFEQAAGHRSGEGRDFWMRMSGKTAALSAIPARRERKTAADMADAMEKGAGKRWLPHRNDELAAKMIRVKGDVGSSPEQVDAGVRSLVLEALSEGMDPNSPPGFWFRAATAGKSGGLTTSDLGVWLEAGGNPDCVADPASKARVLHVVLTVRGEPEDKADLIDMLVSAGADPNSRDGMGRTPGHTAAVQSEGPEVFVALMKAGANFDLQADNGKSVWAVLDGFGSDAATPVKEALALESETRGKAPAEDSTGRRESDSNWRQPRRPRQRQRRR